jgi:fructokinase
MQEVCHRVGIDWGGTKLEGILLSPAGRELGRKRVMTPRGSYRGILSAVTDLALHMAEGIDCWSLGIGMPGSLAPGSGLVQVSNTEELEGRPVKSDLEALIGREVRIANDADCLAVSEARDGAGQGKGVVFAAILGTGVGAGLVVDGRLIVGPNRLTGEWGQNPIPGPMDDYERSVSRHCGRVGAIEALLSGPGLSASHRARAGEAFSPEQILSSYREGCPIACGTMELYFERAARAFSSVVNLLDPDVIVCGGGMSGISELYGEVPRRILRHVASARFETPILPSLHGASSGVRGAAWLWG